mmetsp:Transcript_46393/g.122970  ORF Transcript_46393/g.122970 Transcript_46393/m.122970 type:complete len:315 (-) Transcript_46393:1400-2344(-)
MDSGSDPGLARRDSQLGGGVTWHRAWWRLSPSRPRFCRTGRWAAHTDASPSHEEVLGTRSTQPPRGLMLQRWTGWLPCTVACPPVFRWVARSEMVSRTRRPESRSGVVALRSSRRPWAAARPPVGEVASHRTDVSVEEAVARMEATATGWKCAPQCRVSACTTDVDRWFRCFLPLWKWGLAEAGRLQLRQQQPLQRWWRRRQSRRWKAKVVKAKKWKRRSARRRTRKIILRTIFDESILSDATGFSIPQIATTFGARSSRNITWHEGFVRTNTTRCAMSTSSPSTTGHQCRGPRQYRFQNDDKVRLALRTWWRL